MRPREAAPEVAGDQGVVQDRGAWVNGQAAAVTAGVARVLLGDGHAPAAFSIHAKGTNS